MNKSSKASNAIKLESGKLLGFRLVEGDQRGADMDDKLSNRVGSSIGSKPGLSKDR